MEEFHVYQAAIAFLGKSGWSVVCASPPGGTDNRYRKCLFPRRTAGDERGLRDEIDIVAVRAGMLLLIECKPTLLGSLTLLNRLGESDVEKLLRIQDGLSPTDIATVLEQGLGTSLGPIRAAAVAIAIGEDIEDARPSVSALQFVGQRVALWFRPPLSGDWFEPQ